MTEILRVVCFAILITIPSVSTGSASKSWSITLEEPTGIYRRDDEIVTVLAAFNPGEVRANTLRVISPENREVVTQVAMLETHPDGSVKRAEILFPASIVPGERPIYRLIPAGESADNSSNESKIVARRLGVGRFEMANDRFGVILNLGLENTEPAMVSAFNKSAGELRQLNLIDTSPDIAEPLADGRKSSGFGTFLASRQSSGAADRAGPFDRIEIIESGPLRARVKLSGARPGDRRETWEFTWAAGSPVLRWRSSIEKAEPDSIFGFFFSAVSATPYEPFDRWIDGEETRFPDGWETDNPPDRKIEPQDLDDLPGRQILYYQRRENYGAIAFYELDPEMKWKGIGGRQFIAPVRISGEKRSIETAIAFPNWQGTETVLEGRKEYRKFMQPILSVISESPSSVDQTYLPLPKRHETESVRRAAGIRREMPASISAVSLDGQWKLKDAEKSEGEKLGFHRGDFDDSAWRSVEVPGTVHTQILPEPEYYTQKAEWISAKEWWYRRSFPAPAASEGRRLWLKFEATDYYADIYLNGRLLGRHEGYIDPYQIEVTGKLKLDGANSLSIRLWTPVSYYWRHRPYTIKGSYGAVDQKPDKITPLGITRPVHLLVTGPAIINHPAIDTRLNSDGSATVITDLELDAARAEDDLSLTLALTPRNFDSDEGIELKSIIALPAGISRRRFTIQVAKPQLWWTWDHGKPNLYTLAIRVEKAGELSDSRSLAVGIRQIEHIDWKFYLNGRRMFIRGTNSYYHLFMSEMRRRDYERDIALMRSMNINMIRLHCHFSNPEFYDLCDELGIMIWQDYLEAWYPEDRAFSLKAAGLYDPHIRYVRNHPSVAVWATSDEESLENYRDLTKHLEPRLYLNDPQRRPVVRSTGRYGDGHIYEGWYGGTIWEYTRVREKFISELGATALPDYESLIKFLPDHWPIRDHADEWVFRKLQIFEAMRAWGEPGNLTLREYIPQTQDYVARLFQLAIERMRRLKYQPAGGILHFHAIDLWPSVTMAALDFYRRPTRAFYTVQRSFQMVLPSFAYDRDSWATGEIVRTELWLINDHWHAIPEAKVSWRLVDNEGKILVTGAHPTKVNLGEDSSMRLTDVQFTAPAPGKYTLWAQIDDAGGKKISENNYEFRVTSR